MQPSSTRRSRPPTSRPDSLRSAAQLAVLLAAALLAAPAAADQTDPRLAPLFAELAASSDAVHALGVEQRIWAIWVDHEDPAMRQAMERAGRAMEQRRHRDALSAFSRIIEDAPDFAEAWNKRATIHYILGDFERSVSDVVETLRLEPRHFGALSGLALIYGQSGQPAAAAEALKRALEIHPRMAHGKERLRTLQEETGKPI